MENLYIWEELGFSSRDEWLQAGKPLKEEKVTIPIKIEERSIPILHLERISLKENPNGSENIFDMNEYLGTWNHRYDIIYWAAQEYYYIYANLKSETRHIIHRTKSRVYGKKAYRGS